MPKHRHGPPGEGHRPHRGHKNKLPFKQALYRTFLKLLLLGGLIWQAASSLMCDCALNHFGGQIARGTNMLLRFTHHYGFCMPYAAELTLMVMRNQYKIAILIQFSTLILCLMTLKPGGFAPALLKRLLFATALLRFINIDTVTGEFVALSVDEFQNLLHLLVIIGTLELMVYER